MWRVDLGAAGDLQPAIANLDGAARRYEHRKSMQKSGGALGLLWRVSPSRELQARKLSLF
jgi:hypothetical protein